jgi:hypothetical protein
LDYPWYEPVTGDYIQQGDILEDCPVFIWTQNRPVSAQDEYTQPAPVDFETRTVIVMSQSCDMAKGREKITEVLLCAVWDTSDLGALGDKSHLEEMRKGRLPAFALINEHRRDDFNVGYRVVDFRRIHSLPLGVCRQLAVTGGKRLRLLPPYREHLSQAFARFFMRVGLPVDIPPF